MTKGIAFGIAALAVAGVVQPSLAQDEISRHLGSPVSVDALAEARGGALPDTDFAALAASITDSSAFTTGPFDHSNSIAATAFQNAAGAFTVIQNNGSNAIIQVNTVISVLVQ